MLFPLATVPDIVAMSAWIICFSLVIGAIVVVVLQIYGITRGALRTDEYLDGIIGTLRRIHANTDPLFDLEKTTRMGEEMRATVAAIDQDTRVIVDKLMAGEVRGRSRMLA